MTTVQQKDASGDLVSPHQTGAVFGITFVAAPVAVARPAGAQVEALSAGVADVTVLAGEALVGAEAGGGSAEHGRGRRLNTAS